MWEIICDRAGNSTPRHKRRLTDWASPGRDLAPHRGEATGGIAQRLIACCTDAHAPTLAW